MTVPRLTGATRLYAIIGDPIAQVRSPEVFTERFAAAGQDAVLIPMHVPASGFDRVLPALLALGNLDGLLITLPFKARIVPFAARVGETAAVVGAVNALRREHDGSWSGDMFDGEGFVRAAEIKGARVEQRRVLQFGAGGAGSAIACALARAHVAAITLVDPERERVTALLERLRRAFPHVRFTARAAGDALDATAESFDMIVNASPVGMRAGDGLPGPIGALDPSTLVGDVVITDARTALIETATRHGCTCITGRDMHAGQVDAILQFLGERASA